MSKLKRIKEALEDLLMEFNQASSDKGIIAWEGEMEEKVGLFTVDEEGKRTKAEDGDYKVESLDKILTVSDGKVTSLNDIEAEDKETGNKVEDNKNDNMEDKKKDFTKTVEEMSQSYGDKERLISAAVASIYTDCYVYEAGDDYAVLSVWDDSISMSRYFKVNLLWSDENTVSLSGEPVEVEYRFVPVTVAMENEPAPDPTPDPTPDPEPTPDPTPDPEPQPETDPAPEPTPDPEPVPDEKDTKISELTSTIEELKAKIEELSKAPAARSAEEEFNNPANGIKPTGNKGLDRATSILTARLK